MVRANTNLSGHSDPGACFPSPGFQSAELSRHLQRFSECLHFNPLQFHLKKNLTHLHRNRLLREIESRGCGARRGNYKNLVQDVRQICASRHMFWFGCYLKVSPLASLGLQFFTSAAIPRDALFRINISNAAPCDRVSIMKQWWNQICTRNCASSRNDH